MFSELSENKNTEKIHSIPKYCSSTNGSIFPLFSILGSSLQEISKTFRLDIFAVSKPNFAQGILPLQFQSRVGGNHSSIDHVVKPVTHEAMARGIYLFEPFVAFWRQKNLPLAHVKCSRTSWANNANPMWHGKTRNLVVFQQTYKLVCRHWNDQRKEPKRTGESSQKMLFFWKMLFLVSLLLVLWSVPTVPTIPRYSHTPAWVNSREGWQDRGYKVVGEWLMELYPGQ